MVDATPLASRDHTNLTAFSTVDHSGNPTQDASATAQNGQAGASITLDGGSGTITIKPTALIKAGSGGRGGNATAKGGAGDPTSHQVAGNATAVGARAATHAS